jgi:hypothetical protein
MKTAAFLLCVFLFTAYSHIISGSLVEYSTLTPIKACLITFDSLSPTARHASATSDAAGAFLCDLSSGVYTVQFTHDDYIVDTISNLIVTKDSGLGTIMLYSKYHTFIAGEKISGIWTKEKSPYVLLGDHAVQAGETLSIGEGCKVLFPDSGSISVDGTIQALGKSDDSIFFDGQMEINLYSPSEFLFCDFKNARYNCLHYICSSGKITVRKCLFQKSAFGLYLWHGDYQDTLVVENCTFVQNTYDVSNPGGPGVVIIKNSVFMGISLSAMDGSKSTLIENCFFMNPIKIENAATIVKDNIFLKLDLSDVKGILKYNCIESSSGSPQPGVRDIALVNKNGDSCDLYFNLFKNPEVNIDKFEIYASSPCIGADEEGENIGPPFPLGSSIGESGGKRKPFPYFDRYSPSSPHDEAITIAFEIQCNEMTTMKIYDCRGICIRTLLRGNLEKGDYSLSWDRTNCLGRKVSAGLYFIALERGHSLAVLKSVIAR